MWCWHHLFCVLFGLRFTFFGCVAFVWFRSFVRLNSLESEAAIEEQQEIERIKFSTIWIEMEWNDIEWIRFSIIFICGIIKALLFLVFSCGLFHSTRNESARTIWWWKYASHAIIIRLLTTITLVVSGEYSIDTTNDAFEFVYSDWIVRHYLYS